MTAPAHPAVQPRHVLVVEDESLIAMLHEHTLETAGFRVSVAASGEEALAMAHKARPDCVVLDLRFPGTLQGQDVLRLLREGAARGLPVIVVTGFQLTPDQWRALDETGGGPPVPVLRKPCDPDLLVAELVACLGGGAAPPAT